MRFLELKIPPAVIVLISAVLMWLVSVATPGFTFLFPGRSLAAGCMVLVGAGLIIFGGISFHRAKTTVNPMKPGAASSLVVGGLYRFTRNPMYFGAFLMLLGWAIFLGNPLSLALIALYVAYMNRFQIAPEERALEDLFREEFQTYKIKVRRWI
jgi:protein-S-isoprenylcysteine O-methyltransferase Ste14